MKICGYSKNICGLEKKKKKNEEKSGKDTQKQRSISKFMKTSSEGVDFLGLHFDLVRIFINFSKSIIKTPKSNSSKCALTYT